MDRSAAVLFRLVVCISGANLPVAGHAADVEYLWLDRVTARPSIFGLLLRLLCDADPRWLAVATLRLQVRHSDGNFGLVPYQRPCALCGSPVLYGCAGTSRPCGPCARRKWLVDVCVREAHISVGLLALVPTSSCLLDGGKAHVAGCSHRLIRPASRYGNCTGCIPLFGLGIWLGGAVLLDRPYRLPLGPRVDLVDP